MTRVWTFTACLVLSDYQAARTWTLFPDGACVFAVPHDTDAYRETAERLGYGSDTAACSREHEYSHCLLAEALGFEHSRVLWDVAHDLPLTPYVLRRHANEEEVVMIFQRALNEDGRRARLSPWLADLRARAIRDLRG